MSTELQREERYIVFKLSDVEEHFTPGERQQLARLAEVQRVGRSEAGKPPLECVVVEKDWAEYEPTWKAIEARMADAQPSPSEKDEPIRKAWARFSNALHRSPDAPYPGMSEAFEQHFSQSFTDREWRAESATWAAAWKAAKRHEAQAQPAPIIPEGWLRAIDEALVVTHLGVANAHDTYEQAKAKLDSLIGFHVDIAIEPAVNGGWKLVPIEPTEKMINEGTCASTLPGPRYIDSACAKQCWTNMLDAAPEAKP